MKDFWHKMEKVVVAGQSTVEVTVVLRQQKQTVHQAGEAPTKHEFITA